MRNILILILLSLSITTFAQEYKSTRKERNFIVEGNKSYNSKDYKKAEDFYNKALQENPMSYRALYNKALTQIRIGEDEDLKDQKQKEQYLEEGISSMQKIAELGAVDPYISSMANYNLGNIAFKSQDYKSAIEAYKQSLRLDPTSDNARKNLRIAQKKLQKNNQNNQNNQEDKQENKEENKQENQNSQPQQTPPQKSEPQQEQQPQDGEMSQQSAEQILKAMENKENATRQRLQGQINKSQKNSNRQRPEKKW